MAFEVRGLQGRECAQSAADERPHVGRELAPVHFDCFGADFATNAPHAVRGDSLQQPRTATPS